MVTEDVLVRVFDCEIVTVAEFSMHNEGETVWGTGAITSYALPGLPGLPRSSFICASSLEYNISTNEFSTSIDVTLAFSF